jgi:hypothetical protein
MHGIKSNLECSNLSLGTTFARSHTTLEQRRASGSFDFGPPLVQPLDPSRRHDPEVLEEIRQFIAAREPERRRAARARLESAWRAMP